MALPPNDVLSKGFGSGIQIWLGFLLLFYLIGYSAPLSILLGAIAGAASGLIVGWWESKDKPVEKAAPEENSLEDVADDRQRQRRKYARSRYARKKLDFDWNNLKFWKRS